MDDINILLDLPSPSNLYMYHDPETYLESPSSTSTTSSMGSPYDLSYHHMYPSPDHTDGSEANNSSEQASSKPAAKRKRENRYKNAPPSVLSRRRAQNRASQRAYRERKDQRIKDLEVLLAEAQQKNDGLGHAYASLQDEYMKLKSETDTTAAVHYQQQQHEVVQGLGFDPSMGGAATDMDLFLYNDTTGYTM